MGSAVVAATATGAQNQRQQIDLRKSNSFFHGDQPERISIVFVWAGIYVDRAYKTRERVTISGPDQALCHALRKKGFHPTNAAGFGAGLDSRAAGDARQHVHCQRIALTRRLNVEMNGAHTGADSAFDVAKLIIDEHALLRGDS